MKSIIALSVLLLTLLLPAAPAQAQRGGWDRLEKIKDSIYEDLKDVRALNSRIGSDYYARRIRNVEYNYRRVREHINERSVPMRYAYDEAYQLQDTVNSLESEMRARVSSRRRYPVYDDGRRYEGGSRHDERSTTRTYFY